MKTTLAAILAMLFISTGCKKESPGAYIVDTAQSSIAWAGTSPVTENTGTFSLSANRLNVKNGKLVDGTFDIPINSLNVTNLPPDLKPVLTAHLLSADFFDVLVHPMAVFKIMKVEALTGTLPQGSIANANTLITGSLTMIGVTKTIDFPAKLVINDNKITAQALLQINRTEWGMNYAADPALGEHHIYPMVKLNINLVANRNRE
jgi:polyisoprenoid-binding protein YceI